MLRILYADLSNIIKNKGYRSSLILLVVYPMLSALILKAVDTYMGGVLYGEDVISVFTVYEAFLITAGSLYVYVADFTDGPIKNKLISGIKRTHIVLSGIIGGMFIGLSEGIVASIGTLCTVKLFTGGFAVMKAVDVLAYFSAITLASMAVGAFSTLLVFIFGGTNFAYIPGLVAAVLFRIFNMEVADKLYPESGVCTLKGTKLLVYTLYDRYFPYAHFTNFLRWDFLSYVYGAIIMITASCLIGIIVFNKKEIK